MTPSKNEINYTHLCKEVEVLKATLLRARDHKMKASTLIELHKENHSGHLAEQIILNQTQEKLQISLFCGMLHGMLKHIDSRNQTNHPNND